MSGRTNIEWTERVWGQCATCGRCFKVHQQTRFDSIGRRVCRTVCLLETNHSPSALMPFVLDEASVAGWHQKSAAKRIGVTVSEYISRCRDSQKWCSRCRAWHDISRFNADRSRGDGLTASCRIRGAILPSASVEWHKDHHRLIYRQMYAGPGGALIRARVYGRKRNIDPVLPQWRAFLFDGFGGECAYCDSPAETIDHIIPVKLGGLTCRGNLLPACRSCNSSKNLRDLDTFLALRPKAKTMLILDELVMEDCGFE